MAQLFANAARSMLAADLGATDTVLTLAAGTGVLFPTVAGSEWFYLVLEDDAGIEIVQATAHSAGADTLTVVRGQQNTGARAFAAGSVMGQRLTAADAALWSSPITSDRMAPNAVTAGSIAVSAVTTPAVASKSIANAKLISTGDCATNTDPMFEDSTFWAATGFSVKSITDGAVGPNVWFNTVNSQVNSLNTANKFAIDTSKTYLFEVWFRALSTTDGHAFAMVRFFDGAGAPITAVGTGWPNTNASNGNHYFPSYTSVVTPTNWTRYTLTVGPDGTAHFPPGAMYCALGGYMNYLATTPVEVQCNMLRVTEMARQELVVDGAVSQDWSYSDQQSYAIPQGSTWVGLFNTAVPQGRTLMLSGQFTYLFDLTGIYDAAAGSRNNSAEVRIRLNDTVVSSVLLDATAQEVAAYIPGVICQASVAPAQLYIEARSAGNSPSDAGLRYAKNIVLRGVLINK